jgi:hypothetical protein
MRCRHNSPTEGGGGEAVSVLLIQCVAQEYIPIAAPLATGAGLFFDSESPNSHVCPRYITA